MVRTTKKRISFRCSQINHVSKVTTYALHLYPPPSAQHLVERFRLFVGRRGTLKMNNMMITQTELQELLQSTETYRVERTTSTSGTQGVPQDGTQSDTQGINL